MTTYQSLDVVVGLFPFVDAPVRKPRPILIVSNAAFHNDHDRIIGAMITTGAGSAWPSDTPITDLAAAGLRHASLVRLKLFTLPAQAIATRIGALGARDAREIRARFRACIVA